MILYVKVFTKIGNTPFEYFSRLDVKVNDIIVVSIWILSMTYK